MLRDRQGTSSNVSLDGKFSPGIRVHVYMLSDRSPSPKKISVSAIFLRKAQKKQGARFPVLAVREACSRVGHKFASNYRTTRAVSLVPHSELSSFSRTPQSQPRYIDFCRLSVFRCQEEQGCSLLLVHTLFVLLPKTGIKFGPLSRRISSSPPPDTFARTPAE